MKIRTGFVSNSSSSSFVVLLPENFIETVDFNKIVDGDEDFPLDEFKRMLNDLVNTGGMWVDEMYDEYEMNDYSFCDFLHELIHPYVIADIDGPSGGDQIVVVDREKIKKML